MHTLKLSYLSVSLFLSLPSFFLYLSLFSYVGPEWYEPLPPRLTVSGPTGFSRILVFRVESSRENDYQSGRVSHRVKFYRRNISPGDRFITGANASRDSSWAKNSVWRWLGGWSPRRHWEERGNHFVQIFSLVFYSMVKGRNCKGRSFWRIEIARWDW